MAIFLFLWTEITGLAEKMLKIINAQFIKSTLDWRDSPKPPRTEIAFVGRSNVGKSSLINCLVNIRNFARVSKQPGKTRTINYFLIDEKFYLVDLPGYGFARTSKKEQQTWQKALEAYLLKSPHLKILFLLIDSKIGLKENDLQMVEWLEYSKIPYRIIATKTDKITKSAQTTQLKQISEKLNLAPERLPIPFSVKNRTGRKEVIQLIDAILKSR